MIDQLNRIHKLQKNTRRSFNLMIGGLLSIPIVTTVTFFIVMLVFVHLWDNLNTNINNQFNKLENTMDKTLDYIRKVKGQ